MPSTNTQDDDAHKIMETLKVDKELVLRFFVIFSRFEYSLKRKKKYRQSGRKAKPDWKAFGKSISVGWRTAKVACEDFSDAVSYLEHNPPQKQIISGGQLGWCRVMRCSDDSDEQHVLRLIQTVRNNLFHGGKYPTGPINDAGRNTELLESCLTILKQCLELSEPVRTAFHEGI